MKKLSEILHIMALQDDRSHLSLVVMADATKHGAEFLPFILLEAEDDKHTFGNLYCPVEALTVIAAYPEIVARDVVETLGRVVENGHLMVERQSDLAPVTHLLIEADAVVAEDLPAAFAELQAEVEIDTVDEEFLGKASHSLPSLEAYHITCRDGMSDKFRARSKLRMLAP